MDLLMSCGRRDEHARVCCLPVCGRPQLSTACSVVTSRRLAVIMAHSRLGTAERQMWRLHNPCGLMCGDGCLLCSGSRTLHTTAVRQVPHSWWKLLRERMIRSRRSEDHSHIRIFIFVTRDTYPLYFFLSIQQ